MSKENKIGIIICQTGFIELTNANKEYIVVPENAGLYICDASTTMDDFHKFIINGYQLSSYFECICPIHKPHERTPKKKVFNLSKLFQRGDK